MAIKLIIGLRNPGSEHEQSRHNAGAWFTTALALRHNKHFKLDKKLQSELLDFSMDDQQCKLAQPATFMNHSGQATRALSQFYRIQPEEILVVHDELDIPVGHMKLKTGGGHGGHNGLRDIITHLDSDQFHRLRLGIGHPGDRNLVHQYVLGKPSVHDRQEIFKTIERAFASLALLLRGDIAKAMSQLNQ